jgi:hypothetical protein
MAKDKSAEPEAKGEASPAAAVRKEIEKLTGGSSDGTKGPASTEEPPRPKSPREFIQERMRELDKRKQS